jgi:dTDP-4-dehydrorhamnose reductase
VKILLIGQSGQLGQEFLKLGGEHSFIPLSHADVEVSDPAGVSSVLGSLEFDAAINTAAFHRVDDCEDDAEKAFRVNAVGARNVARAAAARGAAVVFISTDYVYGGERGRRIPYTEADCAAPLNVYGASKLAGEQVVGQANPRHYIVRTCGLYGAVTSRKGWTFPEMIINKARGGGPLKVVNDQVLTPTYTFDLVRAIMAVLQKGAPGLYHLTSGGECSWHEFASAALELAGIKADIAAVPSTAFPSKAARPDYSVLESAKLAAQGIEPLRPWREALAAYLAEKGLGKA